MSTNKDLRETIAMITELGLTFVGVERGKHLKIHVEYNGRRRKVVHPTSCSDQRAALARRTFLRKLAREMGANA